MGAFDFGALPPARRALEVLFVLSVLHHRHAAKGLFGDAGPFSALSPARRALEVSPALSVLNQSHSASLFGDLGAVRALLVFLLISPLVRMMWHRQSGRHLQCTARRRERRKRSKVASMSDDDVAQIERETPPMHGAQARLPKTAKSGLDE